MSLLDALALGGLVTCVTAPLILPLGMSLWSRLRPQDGLSDAIVQMVSEIPDTAQWGRWERFHLFGHQMDVQRHHGAVICREPPIALVCPECELRQSPLQHGHRQCDYCGVQLRVHGSRLFWWRSQGGVQEWSGQ